jgi:hypothetical protein
LKIEIIDNNSEITTSGFKSEVLKKSLQKVLPMIKRNELVKSDLILNFVKNKENKIKLIKKLNYAMILTRSV